MTHSVPVSTTNFIAGHEVSDHLGLVVGATKLGSGGTNNVEEASAEAVERLISAAENIGADAVIRVQFTPVTSESSDDYISMFCYGTAVKLAS